MSFEAQAIQTAVILVGGAGAFITKYIKDAKNLETAVEAIGKKYETEANALAASVLADTNSILSEVQQIVDALPKPVVTPPAPAPAPAPAKAGARKAGK